MRSAVALYQKQTEVFFHFEKFYLEFESLSVDFRMEQVEELSRQLADDELKLQFMKNNEILKILHYLHHNGVDIEFSVDFLFEVLIFSN